MIIKNRPGYVFRVLVSVCVLLSIWAWIASVPKEIAPRNNNTKAVVNAIVDRLPTNDITLSKEKLSMLKPQTSILTREDQVFSASSHIQQNDHLYEDQDNALVDIEREELLEDIQSDTNVVEQAQQYLQRFSKLSDEGPGSPIDRVANLFEFMGSGICLTECQSTQLLIEDYVRTRTALIQQILEDYIISEGEYDSTAGRLELTSLQSTFKLQLSSMTEQMPMLSGLPEIIETTIRLPGFLVNLPPDAAENMIH